MAHVATVTISAAQVPSDQTDFVVFIDLAGMPASFWSTVANGGGDIRCFKSDGTTELARDVVSCATGTQTGELHVKYAGTLSASVDTVIQIHADGSSADYAATATYGRNAVWSGYRAVWHLGSTGYTDATGNGNNLSASGTVDTVTGRVGSASDFASGYLFASDSATLDILGAFTFQAWVSLDNLSSLQSIARKGRGTLANDGNYVLQFTNIYYTARLHTGSASYGAVSTNPDPTGWHHVVGRYTGSAITISEDGVQTASTTGGAPDDTGEQFRIGANMTGAQQLDGQVDEVRVSAVSRSDDWLLAEYRNQSAPGTFYSVAAVGGGATDQVGGGAVEAATEVSGGAVAQRHGLGGASVEADTAISGGAVGQAHTFDGGAIEAATSISGGATGQAHALGGASLDAETAISGGAVGQGHAFDGASVDAASSVEGGALGQAHVLGGGAVEAPTSISGGAIATEGSHALDGGELLSLSSIDGGALGQGHALVGGSVEAETEISGGSITAASQFDGGEVVALTEIAGGAYGVAHALGGGEVSAGTEITGGTVAQVHAFPGGEVVSASDIAGGHMARLSARRWRSAGASDPAGMVAQRPQGEVTQRPEGEVTQWRHSA